jgi:hypothetical protein
MRCGNVGGGKTNLNFGQNIWPQNQTQQQIWSGQIEQMRSADRPTPQKVT